MNDLVAAVIEKARQRGVLPSIPEAIAVSVPAINKVEFYPTFRCNDRCAHCITKSGPERTETLRPDDAATIVKHIAHFSTLRRLKLLYGDGRFRCDPPDGCRELEAMEGPPRQLTDSLKRAYADCLQGKGHSAKWISGSSSFDLNFGRPSIRISGGEFFMWPFEIDGHVLADDDRLDEQGKLLGKMRSLLPEYDVWILTNGRFATSRERADRVIERWARHANAPTAGGKTRICISVDVFHTPPRTSSVEQMLARIWPASRTYGLGAPFLYGIPNNRIGYLGRAFGRFPIGQLKKGRIKNVSRSAFNPPTDITVDPIDLIATDGCKEVKGFVFEHGSACLLANNVVVAPPGHLVYCCACLGDYGDFVSEPQRCLKRMVTDPMSLMLRRADTVMPMMNIAVELDPTIKVFGSGEHAAVTGSTCYQLMTGERLSA